MQEKRAAAAVLRDNNNSLKNTGLAKSILAGVVAGVDVVGFSIALAALLFAGSLVGGLGLAASAALLATAILAFVIGPFSGLRGNAGHVQDIGVALLAPALAAMAATTQLMPEVKIATAFAIVAASSLSTGAVMFLAGVLKLGRIIRFFPQTVIAGFLGGTGWLLVAGGISVASGLSMDGLFDLSLWTSNQLMLLAPVVGFALILWLTLPRVANPAALGILLVAGVALFHLFLLVFGVSRADAQLGGWLPSVPAAADFADLVALQNLVDWPTLVASWPTIVLVAALSLFACLMNTSALEAATNQEADPDRELKLTGLGNLSCGIVAGPPGFSALTSSLIVDRIAPQSRVAPTIMGLVAVGGVVAADAIVEAIPIFVTAGLIIYLGADLLHEWLFRTFRLYGKAEWAIVLVIVLAVAFAGMGPAVLLGLGIAIAHFVVNYARLPFIRRVSTLQNLRSTLDRDPRQSGLLNDEGAAVAVYELEGFLFFGTAELLRQQLKQRLAEGRSPALKQLILDFGRVSGMDGSVHVLIRQIAAMAAERQVNLVLSRLRPDMFEAVNRPLEGAGQSVTYFDSLDEAVERAEEMLLGNAPGSVSASEIARRHAVRPQDAALLASSFRNFRLSGGHLARHCCVKATGQTGFSCSNKAG